MERLVFLALGFAALLFSGFGILADPVDTQRRLERKIDDMLEAFLRFLSLFAPPEPFAFANDVDRPSEITGHALARSLQQSMRHEAGVDKRAAARKV